MFTEQQTFDKVLFGIREQGGPSYQDYSCRYRSGGNRKCAAGLLIPECKYDDIMEGKNCSNKLIAVVLQSEGYDPVFVQKLQTIHDDIARHEQDDNKFMQYFEMNMKIFAFHNMIGYTGAKCFDGIAE